MGFREKQAWISLAVTLGVYGVYFFYFGRALGEGHSFGVGGPISLAVVAIVVLQIALNIIAAILSPHERRGPEDERDRMVQQYANAGAFYVLQVLVMFSIVSVYFSTAWTVANLALGALAAAQVAKYAAVIYGYRRGLYMGRPPTRVINRIRTLRFEQGEMTQQALADAVGVTRQTIIAIEQGKYSPTLEAAFRIAETFGVPVESVFQYQKGSSEHFFP